MDVVSYLVEQNVTKNDFAKEGDVQLPPLQPRHNVVYPKLNVGSSTPRPRMIPAEYYLAFPLPSRRFGQSVPLA